MKTIKQIVENMQQPLVETLDQYNQHYVGYDKLDEVLITLAKGGDKNFGNVVILAGGAGCYPKGTEYFNGRRWVTIEKYKKGDNVLVFDKETGVAFLDSNVDYVDLPVDQFYRMKNRRVDFITSENHNHLLIGSKSGKFRVKPTHELVQWHENSVNGIRDKLVTSFNYIGGKGLNLTDDEIRLRIAIMADGYVVKQLQNGLYRIRMSFKRERKIARFEEIINRLNIPYRKFLDSGYTRFTFLTEFGEKEFNDYWYDCSVEQLKVVAEEILLWDGSKKYNSFTSTSLKTIEFAQFLFTALNKDVSLTEDNREGRNKCYSININESKGRGLSKNNRGEKTTTIEKVNCGRRMYCFTTETGAFVVRQNGQIYVSMNSGKGFVLNNVIDIQGKVFNVDALKGLILKNDKIKKVILDRTGKDISKLDLKQPEDVSILHQVVAELGVNDKKQQAMFASILASDPSRKPNLIFDVTLSQYKKLESICRNVSEIGYEKSKIHVVWVINSVDVAIKQNAERNRVVSQEVLYNTHAGVALTIKQMIGSADLRKHMDGKIVFAFNQAKVDNTVVSGEKYTIGTVKKREVKPMYVKEFNYVVIKEPNRDQIPFDKIEKSVIQKISSYVKGTGMEELWK